METKVLSPNCNSNLTTVLAAQSDKCVEKQLRKTYFGLAEAEATADMFRKMLSTGVSTNDVRSFVINQSKLNKSKSRIDPGILKAAMRNKLSDALACVNKLRQEKNKLRSKLFSKVKSSSARKIVKSLNIEAKDHKKICIRKKIKKYEWCRSKQSILNTTSSAPKKTMKIL